LRQDIARWYPELMPYVSLTLVQSADHILNTYDARISEYTERKFQRDGINVLINTRVIRVDPTQAVLLY
jgi:NADH dehydrogenase FAD-containing subunit